MNAQPRTRSIELGAVDGAEFLRFADQYSFDPSDGSRIKSQYATELASAREGIGALGIRACGDLVAAASYGTVPLPRAKALSVRIDVVVTAPPCRGHGLARALLGALLTRFIDEHGTHVEHFSVVAVHPTIKHIVESIGFSDANVGTSSPVLHRTAIGEQQVALRVDAERLHSMTTQGLRAECARCLWGKGAPWCGRKAPTHGP